MADHLPVPTVHIGWNRRDLLLDACRGLALWFIYIDHIPNSSLDRLTLRNYGSPLTAQTFGCAVNGAAKRSAEVVGADGVEFAI